MERFSYGIISEDSYGHMICVETISSVVKFEKENYIPILEEQVWTIFGKMWTGTEWVDNPNPPIYSDPEVN